jgi:hypothetical protein
MHEMMAAIPGGVVSEAAPPGKSRMVSIGRGAGARFQ